MRTWRADLHIHTCLSPCAALSMGPRTIVAEAAGRRLNVIGVADHNSAGNVTAVLRASSGSGVEVLPGMEVTSREEVHILALFDDPERALALQEIVYRNLPGRNQPEKFGLQVLVNEDHDVVGFEPRLLAGATELTIGEVVEAVHRLGGLAIAAHADREAFGLFGQLGFVPPGLELDALEITRHTTAEEARRRWPECGALALVRFSDAHSPEQIGTLTTRFRAEQVSVPELQRALRGQQGRSVLADDEPGRSQ